jgi:hypothetical protein
LWTASNVPAWLRFRRALSQPLETQHTKLRDLLRENAATAFGRAHGFSNIDSYAEFRRRVPLSDYGSLEPWIARIRAGERRVLTSDTVTHLVPTSGSTTARKLIPFTTGLQREFNAAIGPWLADLVRQSPGLIGGRAYWAITPVLATQNEENSVVPTGFDSDSTYLGGSRRRLAEAVMAVPASVTKTKSLDQFRFQTLVQLLVCRDLRLISVWHPSFLTLLLDALPDCWDRLVEAVEKGTDVTAAFPRRARELRELDPLRPKSLWPSLRLISCWGGAAAALPFEQLRKRFPTVLLQPKGLISTEGFVSLPFEGKVPVAVCSHFFEFIDSEGQVGPVDALRQDQEYEVAVTTAGGFWRYRLGDRVRVTGFLKRTPCLEFIGRGEDVSDRCGEKLSEAFVCKTLNELFGSSQPRFALLAPDGRDGGWRYTLFVEGAAEGHWPEALETALRHNPQYACCRDLGQLSPASVFIIAEGGYESYARRLASHGARLGDIKPAALSRLSGWNEIFTGFYAAPGVSWPGLCCHRT